MMFPGVTPEQQKQAMGMALMSAGMGTLGATGSAGQMMNQGFQQGMGTYMPMMQWMQQSALSKEDKEYKKKRDKIKDRYLKNQESAQAVGLDQRQQQIEMSAASQRAQNTQWNVQNKQARDEWAYKMKALESEKSALGNLIEFATGGIPGPGQMGPRVGNVGKGTPPTSPMTPQQWGALSAAFIQAGANPQAVKALGEGQFGAVDPSSPYFKGQTRYSTLEKKFSEGKIPSGSPEYQELMQLRKGTQQTDNTAVIAEMVKAMQQKRP